MISCYENYYFYFIIYYHKSLYRYLPKILINVSKEKKKRYFKYLEVASIFIDNIGTKVRNFNFITWKNKLDVIEVFLCYYYFYENNICESSGAVLDI